MSRGGRKNCGREMVGSTFSGACLWSELQTLTPLKYFTNIHQEPENALTLDLPVFLEMFTLSR